MDYNDPITATAAPRQQASAAAPSAADDVAALAPKPKTDRYIWGTYLLLVFISLVELYSASSQEVTASNIYRPILRHAGFLFAGLCVMLGLQRVHYSKFFYWIPVFTLISVIAMVYVCFAGVKINGARRAIDIGVMLVLPAEMLKLSAALMIAWILSRCQLSDRNDVKTWGCVACAVMALLFGALLFEQGLTNTLLLMSISCTMMIIGGVGIRKLAVVICIYAIIGGGAYLYKTNPGDDYQPTPEEIELARLNGTDDAGTGIGRGKTWNSRTANHWRLDKYKDTITSANRQEQLSYIAQAHGGVFGVGPGNSRETARLPLAFSDYIYAIVIEDCGLWVGILVLICYLWLLARAGYVVSQCNTTFPALLVLGAAVYIVYQALFHMAIVTGVVPVSGQPLPLISKGGLSILITSMAFGIMLSVSRHAARRGDAEAIREELQSLPESMRASNPSQL